MKTFAKKETQPTITPNKIIISTQQQNHNKTTTNKQKKTIFQALLAYLAIPVIVNPALLALSAHYTCGCEHF